MSPLAVVLIVSVCLAVIGIFFAVLRWENHRDDRRAQLTAESRAAMAWLMRARYGNTWGAQSIRASLTAVRAVIAAADPDNTPWEPRTSPVNTQPATPPRRAPGTAAAAAGAGVPPPPLLPTPWLAANHPDQVPFREWEKDDFVLAVNDLKDGA